MNLNKTLSTLALFFGFVLGLGSMAHAEDAADSPPGVHPTAARVVEANPSLIAPPAVELVPATPVNDADLWQRIRRGFVMADLDSVMVQNHERWYSSRPDYIQRFVNRGAKYLYHVVEEVEQRGMPTEVALLPIIESAFNPQAYSRAKAAGMWQFIPSTGKNFGLKQDWMADNRRDVLLSTHAALDYLQKLYGMFNSWELAFAAYNCGEGCVARAIQKNQRKGLPTDFLSLKLPPETRQYVPKLLAVKNIVLAPASFGIALDTVENRPYFGKVTAPAKIDVKLAARLAEMPEEEFSALNPAFNRPVASSETGYFLVPADKAMAFRTNMVLYRSLDGPLVSWQTVNAKRGESVDTVARRHGLTASYLRATNISLPERKGKLTQNTSIMVPMHKEAKIITATLDKRDALKASQTSIESAPLELVAGEPIPLETNANDEFAELSPAPISIATYERERPMRIPIPAAELVPPAAAASTLTTAPARYTVQSGDTLFSISKRFGVTVEHVKALNRMTGNTLQAGQSLRIDGEPASAKASAEFVAVRAAPVAKEKPAAPQRIYTVRPGDSLFAIAAKFGVELDDLLRWNKLSGRTIIQPGLKIRLASL